ncbi:hypothetical protein AGMMS49974_05460 [Deltaproteobacteria bacterium]|nr:hypothetical protein AGMMS49974_05460 [Deltaproteobacteria bacterium]
MNIADASTRQPDANAPPDKQPLFVIVSLDVEEEGLFSGRYAAAGCGVRNVALLPRLAPLTRELNFPLTLFCAYTVLADPETRATLAFMRDDLGAEIGAHLHHWSTHPLTAETRAGTCPPERTHRLERNLLRRRLRTLLVTGQELQSAPLTSFRMGRWDLKSQVRPLLAEAGITLDSSVCPLRAYPGGPDHFLAPADPYWAEDAPGLRLLEAPITQIALLPELARCWHAIASPPLLLDSFHFWGVASANPVWHSSRIMRLASRLHAARGGRVLHLFWHSSEMLPGASPNVPDQSATDALLQKIYRFLQWLKETFSVQGITAAQLYNLAPSLSFPERPTGKGDW